MEGNRSWPTSGQTTLRFTDRREAGEALARRLTAYAGRRDVVVLALPRGGVPVAFEVARALRAPLDVLVVRKLGFPGQAEFAMGAIASGGVRVLNDEIPPESFPPPQPSTRSPTPNSSNWSAASARTAATAP